MSVDATPAKTETVSLSCYGLSAPEAVSIAREAERVGFDGIWLGEHALTPMSYRSEHPYVDPANPIPVVGPDVPLLDLLVTCAAMAAATSWLFIGTGIYILPLRHPLATAVSAASVQQIGAGRLVLGVGSGWLQEEFRALGQDFGSRGSRMNEIVEICRLAWRGGEFSWHGDHYDIEPVQVATEPIRIPLVFGGSHRSALRRAARWGDGWHSPSSSSVENCRRWRRELTDLLGEAGRSQDEFRFHVRVMEPTPQSVDAYHDAGFTDLALSTLALWRRREDIPLEQKLEDVQQLAETFGRKPALTPPEEATCLASPFQTDRNQKSTASG